MCPPASACLPACLQPDTRKPRVQGYHAEYEPPRASATLSIAAAAKQVRKGEGRGVRGLGASSMGMSGRQAGQRNVCCLYQAAELLLLQPASSCINKQAFHVGAPTGPLPSLLCLPCMHCTVAGL